MHNYFAIEMMMMTLILVLNKRRVFGLWYCILCLTIYARVCSPARFDQEACERFYRNIPNGSLLESNKTLAKMFDRILEKEFFKNDQLKGFIFQKDKKYK